MEDRLNVLLNIFKMMNKDRGYCPEDIHLKVFNLPDNRWEVEIGEIGETIRQAETIEEAIQFIEMDLVDTVEDTLLELLARGIEADRKEQVVDFAADIVLRLEDCSYNDLPSSRKLDIEQFYEKARARVKS